MQHLSTRTLKPSHTESFEDKWTSLVEDFLAKDSVKLESKKESMIQDICSHSSQKESESASLSACFLRMSKESSVAKPTKENQFSNMSSEHWKAWVTEQRREYSQRVKSASLIRENESTFVGYPTPSVAGCVEGGVANNVQMDEKGIFYRYNKKGVKWSVKLRDAVIHQASKNWATPQAFDSVDLVRTQEKIEQTRKEKNAGCMNLREQVHYPEMDHKRNFPTPQASDNRDRGNMASGAIKRRIEKGKQVMLSQSVSEISGALNPMWVEWLMGYPSGWTDLRD
jgi:DNA (cytosine-5)-methyltransferase 1